MDNLHWFLLLAGSILQITSLGAICRGWWLFYGSPKTHFTFPIVWRIPHICSAILLCLFAIIERDILLLLGEFFIAGSGLLTITYLARETAPHERHHS